MNCKCKAIVKVMSPKAAIINANNVKIIYKSSAEEENKAIILSRNLMNSHIYGGIMLTEEELNLINSEFQSIARIHMGG